MSFEDHPLEALVEAREAMRNQPKGPTYYRRYPNPHPYDYAITSDGEIYRWDTLVGGWVKMTRYSEKDLENNNDDDALHGDVIEGDWSSTR